MSALNQLKVERDQRGAARDTVFWNEVDGVIRGPNAEDFAPPGTRLGIKGTPSLGRINTIVMGIRNPSSDTLGVDPANVIEDLTVWINEMRVAGYDESNGWSAVGSARISLADLGSVDARFSTQTDGFGGLSSTLDDREQNNLRSWSVTSTLNVDQPIPERFGWSIPVTVQTSSNRSEPLFSPSTGDIRIDDIIQQIETRDDLSAQEKRERQQYVRDASSTKRSSRSVSARVSKSGSKSRLLRNTLDGITASYSYSTSNASNPSQEKQDDWKWTSSLGYRFTSRKPKTVRPFGVLDKVPVLGVLGRLRFNYLPQSINVNASANRGYGVTQDRSQSLTFERDESVLNFLNNPLRQRHSFALNKTTAFQYNPFQFLNLGLDTNTGQSLNGLGVRSVLYEIDVANDTRVIVSPADTAGTGLEYQEEIAIKPALDVFGEAINGSDQFRTNQHSQRFNATLRTNFNKSKVLDFVQLQDVAYTSQYRWVNGSEGRNDGASVDNQYDIRTGLSIKVQEFWRKFGFYNKLEEAQKNAEREAETNRKARQDARKAAKEAKAKRKEEERAAREAAKDSVNIVVPSDSLGLGAEAADSTAGLTEVDPDSLVVVDSAADDIARRRARAAEQTGGDVQAEPEPEETVATAPRFRFPLPNPVSILRRTALALTGIRDLTITYTGSHSSRSSNIVDPTTTRQPY
ncbi:MAG: cell surface protein SprA, partial [Rhodothermales bacterium]|nr:cell surface protein SprA [Rhodothermales bacterium]